MEVPAAAGYEGAIPVIALFYSSFSEIGHSRLPIRMKRRPSASSNVSDIFI